MNTSIVAALAWTLAHFLWQGALIALLAAMLKSAAGNSAVWRYRISVGAMMLMVLAPLVTFALYAMPGTPAAGGEGAPGGLLMIVGAKGSGIAAGASMPWKLWIVSAWIVGVLTLSLRLVIGWNVAQSLVRTATGSVPETARAVFDRLIARMPMRRPVRLAISERVQNAVVIGWLKPVILLPLAAATGLSFAQLEAILAHELAHIRRHDFAVNVLQCCAECLLFYHPAVWWLSSQIRREREHCCDDLAIAICGDRVVYASALVELESARPTPLLAMAAGGSDLARRIRRIFGQDTASASWKDAALASVLVVAVLAASAFYAVRAQAESPAPAAGAGVLSVPTRNPDQGAWFLSHGNLRLSHSPDHMVGGINADWAAAEAAQKAAGIHDMIWFRFDGKTGIIQDAATMEKIEALFRLPQLSPEKRAQRDQIERQAADIVAKMHAAPPDQAVTYRAQIAQLTARGQKLGVIRPNGTNAHADQIVRDAIDHGLAKPVP